MNLTIATKKTIITFGTEYKKGKIIITDNISQVSFNRKVTIGIDHQHILTKKYNIQQIGNNKNKIIK